MKRENKAISPVYEYFKFLCISEMKKIYIYICMFFIKTHKTVKLRISCDFETACVSETTTLAYQAILDNY